ncbi:MAG TPA: T9SS type A sorting domain-containing protein [Flavipsychrobacter sp.]|nr:T9SS type A sorting domain-containing protein [Flavipsychrobacter sp.]
MNKILTFLFVLSTASAQAQYFSWAKGLFGDSFPGVTSIATDASGNIYIAGSHTDTIDVDPGAGVVNVISPFTTNQVYILKLDASGNFLWVKQLNAASSLDQVTSSDIALDASGNIYVSGYFGGTVDFDPGAATSSLTGVNMDGFVLKLDNSGNFAYVHPMGGTGTDMARALCVDNQGNVMVTGTFEGTADFDPTAGVSNLVSLGMEDVFVVRYNNQGSFAWAKSRGSAGSEVSNTIITDAAGGIFGTTSSSDTLTVFRLDGTGTFTWVKQLFPGSASQMELRRLALDANGGDIYATGYFTSAMDFDPSAGVTTLTPTGMDLYMFKLYNSGNFAWAKKIDAGGIITNGNVIVHDMNNVYLSASYSGTADLDPGTGVHNVTSTNAAPDIFIAKFNSNGTFSSGGTLRGPIDDAVADIAVNTSGDLHLTGVFRDTTDFDPGAGTSHMISPNFGYSTFVLKLTATVSVQEVTGEASDVRIYPNPSSASLLVETGNSNFTRYTITNSTGQILSTKAMTGTKAAVDVSTLPVGVYYLLLEGKEGSVSCRFSRL